MYSPWGSVQTQKTLAEGIVSVTTASHGGILLSDKRVAEFRKKFPKAQLWAGEGAFEEDCDWSLVALCWPELFTPEHVEIAQRTAKTYHPEIY
jgi:hypothetical protein